MFKGENELVVSYFQPVSVWKYETTYIIINEFHKKYLNKVHNCVQMHMCIY